MAAIGGLEAIGLVGDTLSIVSFIKDLIPAAKPDQGAVVSIKAGIDGGPLRGTNLGGRIDNVYGFNAFNAYIGRSGGENVKAGDRVAFTIAQKTAGVRSDFVSVNNGNDATCIAHMIVKQFDESDKGTAWSGDIGAFCGQPWFYSGQKAGEFERKDDQGKIIREDYYPRCTWLDGDHTNDFPSASMKFKVGKYGGRPQDVLDSGEDICSFTTFDRDNGPIKRAPGGTYNPVKRQVDATPLLQNSSSSTASQNQTRPHLPAFDTELIMSDHARHSSKELCESETSVGPDFIGADGMFCDMKTKTLTPLCSTEEVIGCIDVNKDEKTVVKRTVLARRALDVVHKTYEGVTSWK